MRRKAPVYLIFLLFWLGNLAHAAPLDRLSRYLYEDTKQLVMLMENATVLSSRKEQRPSKNSDTPVEARNPREGLRP
jgi:hypothetical protein